MSRFGGLRAATVLVSGSAKAAGSHPLVIIAAVVSAGILMSTLWGRATIWQNLSVSIGGALLPLTGASFLVAAWTVSREIRYGYEEQLDSLPHGRAVRDAGLFGAVVGPLAWAVILVTATLAVAAMSTPAGVMVWPEVLTALMTIPIAWTAGILIRGRMRAAPAVALLGYGVLQLLGSPDVAVGGPEGSGGPDLSRLLLWMPPSAFDSPFEILLRPSWHRLLFLITILTLILAALLVRGPQLVRLVTIGGTLVVAALLAVLVVDFLPSPTWAVTTEARPRVDWAVLDAEQACVTMSRATHCTYPDFESWGKEWEEVVAEAQQVWPVPTPEIAQRPATLLGQSRKTNQVTADFNWDGAMGASGLNGYALAVRLGEMSVGLPGSSPTRCDGRGQARGVFPYWLAALATVDGRRILSDLQGLPIVISLGDIPLGGAIAGPETVALALALASEGQETVTSVLTEHWNELMKPETSLADLAAWFDLQVADIRPARGGRIPRCQ